MRLAAERLEQLTGPEGLAAVPATKGDVIRRMPDRELAEELFNIREWVKADKEKRLVVLPCKVGDALYRTSPSGVEVHRVANVVYRGLTSRWYIDTIPNLPYASEELGKTVFLTREEAEKALKKEMTE